VSIKNFPGLGSYVSSQAQNINNNSSLAMYIKTVLLLLIMTSMVGALRRLGRTGSTSLKERWISSSSIIARSRKDFIDIEDSNDKSKLSRRGEGGDENKAKTGSTSGGGFFNSIARIFGQDEESKKKKEQKKKINSAIDKLFDDAAGPNLGLAGAVFKSMAKGVAGMVAEGMTSMQGDMQAVNEQVVDELLRDNKVRSLLGERIVCGMAFQSSSSSMNVNGVTSKSIGLVLPVQGELGSGQAQVDIININERKKNRRSTLTFANIRSRSVFSLPPSFHAFISPIQMNKYLNIL